MISNPSKLSKPAFMLRDPVSIDGIPANRLMVVLRTNGCVFDHNGSGCTMCDFAQHAIDRRKYVVQPDHLLSQLEYAIDSTTAEYAQLDLLTLGSFFNAGELSRASRKVLLDKVSRQGGITKVVTEGRAPYLTEEAISESRNMLRTDQQLEVGLGIESASDNIRNAVLNKQLSEEEIANVMKSCRDAGADFLAYLLVKPPTLCEREAIDDAVESAEWVASLAKKIGVGIRIAFEPVFTTPKLIRNFPNYQCCNLWSVVEILRRVHDVATLFVGLSDEGLSVGQLPSGCGACDSGLRQLIKNYNAHQDLGVFDLLRCNCHAELSPEPAHCE